MQSLIEWVRGRRWSVIMVLLVISSASWLCWFWRLDHLSARTQAAQPNESELEILRQLQIENNTLQAKVQELEVGVGEVSDAKAVDDAMSTKVNINTATQTELDTLPGIGPSKAAAIISYRETHGPFRNPHDVTNVKGIGESTYDALRDLISIQ